ncbi:MAG: GreA/GreB family elongation factor [Dehalococcoidia bacterium]|nr:GreA/GreB family elongation factor [Dehalococcoidia bacterium]MCA9851607.1 GreA/GreB family elongation factor [Dehalococcoidia bacterium]
MSITSHTSPEVVTHAAIPMMAQVYVRLRHRLREVETQLEELARVELMDGDGAERTARCQMLESQAASLRAIVEHALVVPISARVIVGSTVHVRPEPDAPLERYEIVLPTESDPAARKVAFDSPIGRALLGREVGDRTMVETPRGRRELRVMVVRHD